MARKDREEERERRIEMEIVVDAYDEEERVMGWQTYLEDNLQFPFRARCMVERRRSPLKVGEEVQVVGLTSEEAGDREMLVDVKWEGRMLGVPLAQLEGNEVDASTQQAIEDWRYWKDQGYQF